MQIWGKFFGFAIGFMFGKLPGAFLGLWLGYLWDKKQAQFKQLLKNGTNRQAIFFNTTFSVMGHMAKASGQVTETDIRIATLLMDQMQLSGQARVDAQQAFRDGKDSNFDLKSCLQAFRMISLGRPEVLQMFLEIQIQTALSDGVLQSKEQKILQVIAQELGFTANQLEQLLKRWQGEYQFRQTNAAGRETQSIEDAYSVLGVNASASDQEIKRAYRKLMNEHHPDKLIAKGLPPEMMEIANRKAQDIQTAYDRIKVERKIR